MKKVILVISFLILTNISYSQFNEYPQPCQGNIGGGLGLNWIDGKPYYSLRFTPDISLGNFGVGLDLRLDFDAQGHLRTEDFNEASDYLSIIRYVRYGMKHDPAYIKLGALDYYTLGHGSIMYLYNNSPSIDARKIGLVLDLDLGKFGIESIYSKFAEAGVVGFRGYVRPLQYTDAGSIPIIGGLEVGATFAGDYSSKAGIIKGYFDNNQNKFISTKDEGSINIIGIDLGLPLLRTSLLEATLYSDFSKIIDFGSGVATGIQVDFNSLGILTASAKLERRFNNGKYIPAYFNSFYEINRFQVDKANGTFTSKAQMLSAITEADNGYFGSLNINVFSLFNILGSYQRLDKTPDSGILHLGADIEPEGAPFVVRAGYDKHNIKNESDLFKLDDRSYLYSEIGYKPYPFLIISTVYIWTFTPIRDTDKNIIGYEPQKRIEPRISFIFPFDICN